jgi:hypothetical protein
MSLSTLIVQREIASIREVEEALARQVLYGGDFVTNLLEVCKLDEAQLLPLVAESLGLPPAPPGELPRAAPEAMRLIAAEVALERNLTPLTVDRYGLVIAVAAPLSADVEQELAFALALPISQKIAPLVRIRQALARDYGVPLDRRIARLLQKMSSDAPRGSSSFPPMLGAETRLGAPRPPSAAPPGPLATVEPLVRPSAPADGGPRTLLRDAPPPSMRPLRRRRGAITVEVARAELEDAGERDTIFDLLFEFTRQYFDYTAVFVVHGEIAEGRDAFGDGASREKIARIGVPLDLPSVLSVAREKRAMLQKVPEREGLDVVLMSDLGRSGKTLCVVLPVVVRGRVVALLLGDGGDTGLDASTLGDVEGIVTAATAAFERLIVRRKLKGTVPPGTDSIAPRARPSAPPPTKVSEAYRPAVEELAAPIRDLMNEPLSRAGETVREPVIKVSVPAAEAQLSGSERPPPANMFAVRRPSGQPIPREEPDSSKRAPAVTTPSNLGPAARAAEAIVKAADGGASANAGAPRNLRRGTAPKLEFGATPSSSSFGGEPFGNDDAERRLLAEIQGRTADAEPMTSRDPSPPVLAPSHAPPPGSHDPDPPPSPKAESPPPQRVASYRPPAVTDLSPVALPVASNEEGVAPNEEDVAPNEEDVAPTDVDATVIEVEPTVVAIDVSDAPVSDEPPDSEPTLVSYGASPAPVAVVPASESALVLAAPVEPASAEASAPPGSWAEVAAAPPVPSSASRRVPPVPETSRPMPASEQQISVAAHRPPSSRNDKTSGLPSVIVDVSSEYVSLVDRVIAGASAAPGGLSADDAEAELLRAGGHAMSAIMARLPGPITIEPDRLVHGQLPRVAECGPVLRLVASQRRTALPFVLSLVEDPDVERRFWATFLLTELVYPDVIEPLLRRVFDDDPRVRRAARAAARAFADAHPQTIVERLDLVAMDSAAPRARRALAVEALGETREPLAVPALAPLLDDADGEVVAAVRAALTAITRQDFGASSEKWRAWWGHNRERHRLEWLIDALMHDQAALRAAAGEELKTLTKEYFGYYDDLPKRERERAQSRYREWWNSVGRVRFSRSTPSR